MTAKFAGRRRFLALAAVIFALWWSWSHIAATLRDRFEFEPFDGPSGFRQIQHGQTSNVLNPLIGISDPSAPEPTVNISFLQSDLCNALFNGPPPVDIVPIASFSDYNCPYCRVLTKRLSEIEASIESGIRITWHEWPLLGPTSVAAARAALAADMQGAYAPFHERLMRTRFVPTPTLLEIMARDIGIDPDRLLADVNSKTVDERLATTDAIASLFGFVGTPTLVVGRTVVVGSVSEKTLHALIDREREDGMPPVCSF